MYKALSPLPPPRLGTRLICIVLSKNSFLKTLRHQFLKVPAGCRPGESRITSHLHHIATGGIAHRQTSDQAQARPGEQDKYVCHFLKHKKKIV